MIDVSPHRFFVRVYFEDTDAAGIVYYANYLRYAERARAEMIRVAGFASSEMMAKNDFAIGVRRCNIEYMSPARLDDNLEVKSTITRVGGATLNMSQSVARKNEILVKMDLKLGCIKLDGRPSRLPEDLRNTFVQQISRQ